VDNWIGDAKYALRSIAGSKSFAAIVVLTMALGTGANTAVFGVLHAVVLRPLPYDEPERLVRVYNSANGEDGYLTGIAAVAYRDRSQTLEFAPLYTYSAEGADLTDTPDPQRVRVMRVGSDYFEVLRARPMLGRVFDRENERPDAHVAVISERIWRAHLAGAADATGRQLSLNGIPHRIAAVLPEGFDDPLEPGIDIWTPLNLQPGEANSFDNYYLSAIARLKTGITVERAQAELATLAAGMQPPDAPARNRWSARVAPLQADTVGSAGPMLWTLLGAVGLLLAIACVNVASLFLARGAARETELMVRAALGCSGWRLVRQLLLESILLAVAGAIAGLLLSRIIAGTLLAAAPQVVARAGSAGLERAVFLFSLGLAVLAGIGFGVAPALQATRPDLEAMLRESGRSGSSSRRQTRARNVLVVCQMALALVLLTGAGLLLRSFDRLRSVGLGVRPANVLTFEVHLPIGRYQDPARRARFHRDLQARLASHPGVRAAAAVSRLPVTGTYHSWGVRRPERPESRFTPTQNRVIEGPYFDAVGIPLLQGRTFGPDDDANAPRRVVISHQLVQVLFPNEDPIGKTLRVAGGQAEVIGVVGNVALGPRAAPQPYVYHSHTQYAADRNWALTQVVAFDRDRAPSLSDVRRDLAQIDPALVLYEPRMLEEVIAGGVAQERFALLLMASFALLAVMLAAIGLYGVLSYAVTRRRREMGIRLALGAPVNAVRLLVVRDGGRLALLGIGAGTAIALAATRVLRSLLFDVTATEPIVFAGAAGMLAAVAIAASWIPARAATKLDPAQAVRD
jgi:putative ABC transport system permease protein